MSLSAKFKAYNGDLSFAEWKALYLRLEKARAARGTKASKRKSAGRKVADALHEGMERQVKRDQEYARIENRVDCFGINKRGVIVLGADASDGKRVSQLCGGKVVSVYTSKRGERARIETTKPVNTRKLAAAGFTPKGF